MAQIPAEITDMRVVGALAPQSGDTQPPTIPQNLLATAINAGRIDLSWTASTDDIGVSGYQIFRGATPLNTTAGTTYSDTTCQPSTLYSYTVVAFDVAGNSSAASTAATATTPANAAPSWSSVPAQTLIVGNSYSLNLNTYCTDADLDTLTFTITAGTLPTGLALVGSIISGTPTTAGQTPTITVQAADQFHQISTTIAYHSYTTDITAPPVPTGLSASAISTSQINLSWVASTDVAGSGNEFVAGTQDYRLYRSTDGVTYSLRTTILVGTTSYSDTGLGSSTQYFYKITARDSALNESAQSSSVNATTQAVASGFDFYISPSGSDSNPGTQAQPWAITAINTKRATYKGMRVGLLDGTYSCFVLCNSASDHIPVLNVEGGTSVNPTVIASVNPRGAWLNAKSGSTYGGTSSVDGTAIIGNNYVGGVSAGYVTIDGLKLGGSKGNPLWFGQNGGSTTSGIVVKNCEILDCSAIGLASGGNIAALTANQGDGFQVLNCYLHDIVGVTAGRSDHMCCIQTWNTINTTVEYCTAVNAGALLYPKVGTQYNIEVAYNYCDATGYSDGSGCVQDGLSTTPVIAGSFFRVHHNVLKALSFPVGIFQGGTAHECGSQAVSVYNNTLHFTGADASSVIPQSFIAVNKQSAGLSIYNNLCLGTVGSAMTEYGGIWISAGPPTLIDYNIYPTSLAKWSITTNGANFYPTSGGTALNSGPFPWTSLVSGATGAEAHSIVSNSTTFSAGTFATAYVPTGGAAINAGRIGGVIGGATCHIGAWDGVITTIGFDASVRF